MTTTPAINQHGSFNVGSDTNPCTVVEVSKSGHRVTVEVDDFRAGPGHDYYGQQNWVCERRVGGARKVFTRRASGHYVAVGCKYSVLSTDGWFAYRDPSF